MIEIPEEWRSIYEFPGYSVSSHGRVRNDDNERIMTLLRNQQGIINVGLSKNKKQYKRSVTLLVANAFLDPPVPASFDTPINLDGDRSNNYVSNLMWRPRWFAAKYHAQFHNGQRGYKVPIEDVATGQRFPTSWEAAIEFGLIDREIFTATENRTYVWPTYQIFRVV